MKRATIEKRKRFAAELAARDAHVEQPRFVRHTTGKGGGSTTVECVPSGSPDTAPRKAAQPLAPTDDELRERYRMRRWWLDRYSLDEIRELAGLLQ